ncbi:MAG TPA: MEDS domain-containing protein [Actinomycetota bacterium]|nr:MEDS domain-containing protein [Actinomycetota bacterium]
MTFAQTTDGMALLDIPKGAHVCLVVHHPAAYLTLAEALLERGRAENEKLFAFGPHASDALRTLGSAALTADPRVVFLENRPLDPSTMFAMFERQASLARAEGYAGIRVIADMDWLLPGDPSADELVRFELLLDRLVLELGATVVCAYRVASFEAETIDGVAAVHPIVSGCAEPPFRMVSAGSAQWQLSGEVDICSLPHFEAAFEAATNAGACDIDVTGLDFIDVRGMRAVARACASAPHPIRLRGVSPTIRRFWSIAGFEDVIPLTELTGSPPAGSDPRAN